CYLEGHSHGEAARSLGWPVGTVKTRLAAAKELLRTRLARRGLALSATAFAGALALEPARAVPPDRVAAVTAAPVAFAAGRPAGRRTSPGRRCAWPRRD